LLIVAIPLSLVYWALETIPARRLFLIAMIITLNYLTNTPSFTASAPLGSFLSGLFIVIWNRKEERTTAHLVCFITLSIASFVRFDAFLVGVTLLLPLIGFNIFKQGNPRVIYRLGALLAAVVVLIATQNHVKYSCRDTLTCSMWEEYSEHNTIRGSFHGTPRITQLQENLPAIGWSENDFSLFAKFMYPDDAKFNLKTLRTADSITPELDPIQQTVANPIYSLKATMMALNISTSWLLFSFAGLALCFSARRLRIRIFVGVSFGILSWISLSTVAGAIRLPERLTTPMALAACFLVAGLAEVIHKNFGRSSKRLPLHKRGNRQDDQTQGTLSTRFVTLLIFALLTTVFLIWIRLPFGIANRHSIEESIVAAKDAQGDLTTASETWTLLLSSGLSNALNSDPWIQARPFSKIRGLTMGWGTFSPLQETRKELLSVNHLFYDLVSNNSNQYPYVFCGSSSQARSISLFINENTDFEVKEIEVGSVPNVCNIYSFR
jgi:hypothetical protein